MEKQLLLRARREVDEGLLPAAQIALAKDGEVILFESFGGANSNSLFCIFSATKAITSSAAWLLIEEGLLDVSAPVCHYIPEFAENGKDQVTVEQLFTHTAGFPYAPFRPLDWVDKARRMERFAQWRLNWTPGSQFEYHPTATMWVIAELIERVSEQQYVEFVRSRVTGALSLDNLIVGLKGEADNARALPVSFVGEYLTEAEYREMGMQPPPATEVNEETITRFNEPQVRAVGVPGGGGYANAADLALFYQALLHGGVAGASELWSAETLESVRSVRTGMMKDPYFQKLANRGLGIIISGDESRTYRGFGKTNSPLAFGHNGAGGQLAWADPATGLSLAYLTSAHDRNEVRQARRGVAISSLAASWPVS